METTKNETRVERTYKASWYDLLSEKIEKGRFPSWLIYLLIPILWLLIAFLLRWTSDVGEMPVLDPINYVAIFQIGYMLFVCQYLDKLALKALAEFKPALNISQEQYPDLQRLVSTMPARSTLVVSLLFGMGGLVLVLQSFIGSDLDSTISVSRDMFGIFVAITMIVLWTVNGLFVYHTIHQLGVVNYIYTHLTLVHPFHQRELFVFSGFSARTAISLILLTPLWIIFDPGSVSLVISIIFAIFGFITFVSPLLGVHSILVREKDRLLDENARLVEETVHNLMSEIKGEQLDRLKLADQRLTSLEKARVQIERISTWPWRTETLRQILVAILLPIVIWLMQYFLSQALEG